MASNDHQKIPYGRQCIDEEDIRSVASALESPFLTTGPQVQSFEAELCCVTGAKHAIACANGTVALHLACLALGMGPGDTGLTSPNSFLASANCIEYCGGRADFIDIDPSTLCLSPEKLEAYCRENSPPKVVIPVDFAGRPADLPAVKELADQYGFFVIEDAAHALGSVYGAGGKIFTAGSCAHSDLAIFSFHPVKTITTGEGGAVTTNDDALAQKLRILRNHGMEKSEALMEEQGPWYYEMREMGFNYRITDIQCALGRSQLEKLEGFRQRRRHIVSRYNRVFSDHGELILPPKALEETACPHLYPIRLKRGERVRRKVYETLNKEGIFCQIHYIPIYWQPYYAEKYGYEKGRCPNAETYYSQCLSLPLFPAMTETELTRTMAAFLDAVEVNSRRD